MSAAKILAGSYSPFIYFRFKGVAMTARWQVRTLIVALAVLLTLPILFIFAQNEQELSRARNKTLARWPAIQVLATEPERYFSAAQRWMNNRVGLGITAAGLVRWVKM